MARESSARSAKREDRQNGKIGKARMTQPDLRRETDQVITRVYWTVFWCNLGLGVFKLAVGALGYSRLLMLDGMHSVGNSMLILILLFGVHYDYTKTHGSDRPYGLGKSQFAFSMLVGFLLAVAATTALAICIKTLASAPTFGPAAVALATAAISIVANALIVGFLRNVGRIHGELDVKRIARLQWMNIFSSAVAVNSVFWSAFLGQVYVERLGGIVISAIVLWLSVRILQMSFDGVMDHSSDKEIRERVTRAARGVGMVERIEWLHVRNIGRQLCVDLRVGLAGETTTAQADDVAGEIAESVRHELKGSPHVTVDCCPA